MNSCALIIPTCRHILPSGRRCLQPAVRRRSCCRHHLDARVRLHNMARARRLTLVPRLCVPETARDLAMNRAEVHRVVNTGSVDFATARMLFWAMDLAAATFPAGPGHRPRRAKNRASNPNGIYDVALTPVFARTLPETLSQMIENTKRQGESAAPISEALPPGSLPAAPSGLNRAERRRLAAMSHREEQMTKGDKRRAKRERRQAKSDWRKANGQGRKAKCLSSPPWPDSPAIYN